MTAMIIGMFRWYSTKNRYRFALLALNTIFFFGDFRWRIPETTGVAVLSWNTASRPAKDKANPRQECALKVLKEWLSEHNQSVIMLQETRKFQEDLFSKRLGLSCSWSHYKDGCSSKWFCNGLMICLPKNWKKGRPLHRDFTNDSSYGFLQLEATTPEGQTYNLMNLHLESLYNSARTFPALSNKPNAAAAIKHLIKNAELRTGLELLSKNAQTQRIQMDKIADVLRQLNDPTIIAGDYNAPSAAWQHRWFRDDHQDAHRSTGRGFGNTTERFGIIHSRIDFLYADHKVRWSGPTRVLHKVECSDHKPLTSWFEAR